MANRPPRNLSEATYLCARRNGLAPFKAIRYGSDAIALAAALAVAHLRGAGSNGWPTQAEYAAHYGMVERTAQREWARYRQVFGAAADPYDLARALLDQMPAALQRISELGQPEQVLDLALSAPAGLVGALGAGLAVA